MPFDNELYLEDKILHSRIIYNSNELREIHFEVPLIDLMNNVEAGDKFRLLEWHLHNIYSSVELAFLFRTRIFSKTHVA